MMNNGMNEKFRKLYDQAVRLAQEKDEIDSNYEGSDLQEFAELIVKECTEVIEINHPEVDCKESADNLIRRAGRMDAIDEINNYFEVEQ